MNSTRSGVIALALLAACGLAGAQAGGTVHRTSGTHSHIKYPKHRVHRPAPPASGTGDPSNRTTP